MKLVRGENVGQALGFVVSGNARFGIVALSQLSSTEANWPGCVTALPAESHPAVRQAAALLAEEHGAARVELDPDRRTRIVDRLLDAALAALGGSA